MKWTLPVQVNAQGEYYIELNEEILKGSGFQIGDELTWKDNGDGSFTLAKPDKKIYMVETRSVFRHRYAVYASDRYEAITKVGQMLEDPETREFSQYHQGETIDLAFPVKRSEYLKMFDNDNGYLKGWTDDQKFNAIND